MHRTFRSTLISRLLLVALLSSAIIFGGKAWAVETQAAPDPGQTRSGNGALGDQQQTQVLETYGRLPLYFIANQGQKDRRVKYYTQGSGQAVFFTQEGVYFTWAREAEPPRQQAGSRPSAPPARKPDRESQLFPGQRPPEMAYRHPHL